MVDQPSVPPRPRTDSAGRGLRSAPTTAPSWRRLDRGRSVRRRLRDLGLLVVAAISLLAIGCGDPAPPPVSDEEVVVELQVAKLRALLATDPSRPLIPFGDVLVVVAEPLVQSLLDTALPIEGVVSERFLVRLERATVTLDDGLALVRLEGRARLTGTLADAAIADVVVQASLDVMDLDAASGTLRARVKIHTFETSAMTLLGLDAPGRELVSELARAQLAEVEPLLSSIEIPVRIDHALELPGVGPAPVAIPARALPLRAAVTSVVALRHQLFVTLEVALGADGARP